MVTLKNGCWLCLVLLVVQEVVGTERPIIGILTQETDVPEPGKYSYIPSSYIKAVEGSGARAVPIFMNQTQEYYRRILTSVNGVVLPGGNTNFSAPSGYGATGKIILEISMQLQRRGAPFPVLGVCQGFELMMYQSANSNYSILDKCNGHNLALPIRFKPGFNQSRLYGKASKEIIQILQTLPSTSNHHGLCVLEASLKQFRLDKSWRVLSTTIDSNGLEYISSVEHYTYPFAGVQFHPEKNSYEWNPTQTNPHFYKAVLSARHFYDWIVTTSRLNNHSFSSIEEERRHLIYNYSPEYTGKSGGFNEQLYFFA